MVSRLLVPMINEAAMMLGANHPMGPLALGDLIGLDTCLKVRAGFYGRKSGEGFFKY